MVLSYLSLLDAVSYIMACLYFQLTQVRFQHSGIHDVTGEVISMCCSLCVGDISMVVFSLNLVKGDNIIR